MNSVYMVEVTDTSNSFNRGTEIIKVKAIDKKDARMIAKQKFAEKHNMRYNGVIKTHALRALNLD